MTSSTFLAEKYGVLWSAKFAISISLYIRKKSAKKCCIKVVPKLNLYLKNLFRTSAVPNSILTDSPFSGKFILCLVVTLSGNDGFIVFQKSLLLRLSFSFKFAKYFFLRLF